MASWTFEAAPTEIPAILQTVEEHLTKWHTEQKTRAKTLLAAEESLTRLVGHSDKKARVRLEMHRILGDIRILLSVKGEPFPFLDETPGLLSPEEADDADAENAIRNAILRSYARDVRYKHTNGKNRVSILTARSPMSFLYQTLGAFAAAILFGIVMKNLVSEAANAWIVSNVLSQVQTVFMNALKMVVAPVVFLSIVGSIAQFSDLRDVGRIGGKVLLIYVITSVIAVGVGIGAFALFRPGDPSLRAMLPDRLQAEIAPVDHVSLLETLVGAMPGNFLKAFVENNMLQLILLAVITGVAMNAVGEKGDPARKLFGSLNEIFMHITGMFVKLVPLIVFCSMLSTILSTGPEALSRVLSIMGTLLAGYFCMGIVYCLLIAVLGRLNPFVLLKKYMGTMLQVFSLSSSNASISLNMDVCGKKLGISKRLYSLSIPLGATLNMDGLCINLAIVGLSLANVFGVIPGGATLVQMAVTIIIISMGMPGIPGTALIGLAMILPQLHVPVEAIGLIMGIYALADMFETVNNCLGDVSATLIVAKSEKLIDEKVYYS